MRGLVKLSLKDLDLRFKNAAIGTLGEVLVAWYLKGLNLRVYKFTGKVVFVFPYSNPLTMLSEYIREVIMKKIEKFPPLWRKLNRSPCDLIAYDPLDEVYYAIEVKTRLGQQYPPFLAGWNNLAKKLKSVGFEPLLAVVTLYGNWEFDLKWKTLNQTKLNKLGLPSKN